MKLDVPFYKQTNNTNCGPVALKMVFSFFDNDFSVDELEEKTGIKEGKAVSILNLAKAAVDLGFKIKILSKSLLPIQENLDIEFYKKFSEDGYVQKANELMNYLKWKNVEMVERSVGLNELLSYISEKSVPVVLLDWNVIFPRYGGYNGHFVPVVGYDEGYVFVHNHGFKDTQEFMPLKKELFDKARMSKGTDEDILIIYRKL